MKSRAPVSRGIVIITPPTQTYYPERYPMPGDSPDVVITKAFILAVGTAPKNGFFIQSPRMERAIHEKQLRDGTFAYVSVEIRLQPKGEGFVPIVTRENIQFTNKEYENALGKDALQRLIGKRVNREVRRIIQVTRERHHRLQKQKAEAAREKTRHKNIRKLVIEEKKEKRKPSVNQKMTRMQRALKVNAVRTWRVIAGRPRPGVRRK